MKETKRKVVALAALLIVLPSCLIGCGKKTANDSSKVETTKASTTTTVTEPPLESVSDESVEEQPDELADANGYEAIQMAVEKMKQAGADVRSFRTAVTIKGVYSPRTETVVTKAGTSSEESYEETKIEYGEPEAIEAYYTIDVTQAGAHLKGVRFKNSSSQRIEAYYIPSETETTIYYQCDASGIWHKYSSYSEFVIPKYLDDIRDNASVQFVNANVKSTPADSVDEYVIETKITDDRLAYVNSAFFESIFFSELSSHNVSGVTAFTIADNKDLKNISLELSGEQVDVTVSADIYKYNSIIDTTVPQEALAAEAFDYEANGSNLWVEEKTESDTDSSEAPKEENKDDSSSKTDKKKSKKK